jgi:hypothetical protein
MSDTFETDTPQAPARRRWLLGLKKASQREREITAKVAATERLRPRTFMAQGVARKHGVSKHGPALSDVRAHGSVVRGRFAAPQYEVIGGAARNKAVVDSLKTNNPAKYPDFRQMISVASDPRRETLVSRTKQFFRFAAFESRQKETKKLRKSAAKSLE